MTDTADIGKQVPYEVEKLSDESLALDDAVLHAQGHRPELARSFSWVGAIGLSFSIANSWLGYGATFGTPLAYGGGPTTLFGVMIAAVAQWVVLLGLAELCSALPSSGVGFMLRRLECFGYANGFQGQYHFTYILAPFRFKKFAAYTVGITNVIAWWVSAASGIIYTGISAFGIAVFWYPDFQHERWQIYLCYVLVVILTVVPVFAVPQKRYDYLTETTFTLSITGLLLILIAVLVTGRGRYHPETLTTYQGTSGWSPAPAWLLSITMGQYCYAAIGAVTHIAEEMPRPGRRIPLVMYD